MRAGVLASSRSYAHRTDAERGFTETVESAQRRATQIQVPFSVELVRQGVLLQRCGVLPARKEA